MVEAINRNARSVVDEFEVVQMPIKDIKGRGGRVRKDYGDIPGLANNIKEVGLLVPVAVNEDNILVYGGRRIKAFEHLKRKTIACVVIRNKKDELALKKAEEAENVQRKDFNLSERQVIATAIRIKVKLGSNGGRGPEKFPDSTPYWKEAGFNNEGEYIATTAVVNKAQSSKDAKKIQAVMDAGVISPSEAQLMLRMDSDTIGRVVSRNDLPDDPEEVRQNRKQIEAEMKEYKKREREKEKKRKERQKVKLYFDRWTELQRLTRGIEEEFGSVKEMVQHDPWNQPRNVSQWKRFDVLLKNLIPLLQQYHRETKGYLRGK